MSSSLRELDQKLAGELHRRKVASEMEQIKVKMAIENSEEIKHLRNQIQQGYLNKDRSAQVAERQTRSLIEKAEEAMIDRAMLENRTDELGVVRDKEIHKKMQLLKQKEILHDQMHEKKQKCDEARDEFLKEKDSVDDIVKKIINEDRRKLEVGAQNKQKAFATMQYALSEKEEIKRQAFERERLENEAYKQYLESLDVREYEFKMQKKELEEAKEKIYLQMKVRQEREQAEQE